MVSVVESAVEQSQRHREAASERAALRRRSVLLIGQSLPAGADRRTRLQAASMRDAGLAVSVLVPEGESGTAPDPRLAGVRVLTGRQLSLPANETAARSALRGEALDIARTVLQESFRPPGFALMVIAQPAETALPLVRLGQLLGKIIVVDYRTPAPEAVLEQGMPADSAAYRAALQREDKLLAAADVVLCPTAALLETLYERTAVSREKLVLVPTGRDLGIAGPRVKARAIANPRRHLVAFAGPLVPHSGADLFLRMARRIVYGLERHDIQFILAGSGPQAGAIRDLVAAEGLQDFVTCLPGDDPALIGSVLTSADLAVDPTPSSRFGALIASAPLLDYGMLGVPAVAFRRGEAMQDRDPRILTVENGIPALARGIIEALAEPPPRGVAYGPARLWAEEGGPALVAAIQGVLRLEPHAREAAPATADIG